MAKGRQGFLLEGWKFGVYLGIPILASWYYSDPERQKKSAEYWQYVRYPANPNTNLKQQVEGLRKQEEQRKAYREQMKALHRQANSVAVDGDGNRSKGWFTWFR